MNDSKPIEICVVEDHEDIRNGFVFMINAHPEFKCTAYKSGEEILSDIQKNTPAVIVMDIHLPGINGIECTRRIKEKHPDTLIMMCSVFEDAEGVFDALKAGASGYILKRTSSETLIESIKELLKGGAPMSSDIARKVVNSFRVAQPEKAKTSLETQAYLTNKENEILGLLSEGYSNKEIAAQLFISANTVKTHIYRIYEKLHVHSKIEALNKIKKATQ
jgi:DNA-binding NarL/FixJ family response regulator